MSRAIPPFGADDYDPDAPLPLTERTTPPSPPPTRRKSTPPAPPPTRATMERELTKALAPTSPPWGLIIGGVLGAVVIGGIGYWAGRR